MIYRFLFIFYILSIPTFSTESSLEIVEKNDEIFIKRNKREQRLTLERYKRHSQKEKIKFLFEDKYQVDISQFLLSKGSFRSTDNGIINFIKSVTEFEKERKTLLNWDLNHCPAVSLNGTEKERDIGLSGDRQVARENERLKNCRDNHHNAGASFSESSLNPYYTPIASTQKNISLLRKEYKDKMGGGSKAYFTSDLSFLDIEGEEKQQKNFKCFLGVPGSTDIEELRSLIPGDGSSATIDSINNPSYEKIREGYNASRAKCMTYRDMNTMFKSLLSRSREEAEFISLIKYDVVCRLYQNGALDREYINSARELVRNARTENLAFRSSLLQYLENLSLSNDYDRSEDEYDNIVWRNTFTHLNTNCSNEKDVQSTASEFANTLNTMFQSLYISDCQFGKTGLLVSACHDKAMEYAIESKKKLINLERKLLNLGSNRSSWTSGFNQCLEQIDCGTNGYPDVETFKGRMRECIGKL